MRPIIDHGDIREMAILTSLLVMLKSQEDMLELMILFAGMVPTGGGGGEAIARLIANLRQRKESIGTFSDALDTQISEFRRSKGEEIRSEMMGKEW